MMPICNTCGKTLTHKLAKACQKHRIRSPLSEETKGKLRQKHLGKKLSKEHRDKLSVSHLGQVPWNKDVKGRQVAWNKGVAWPDNSKAKMSLSRKGKSPWNIGRKSERSGPLHPNWRGGVTPINEKARRTIEYKVWRKSVMERDQWTCQECKHIGGDLHADHIRPFAYFPDLRYEVSNGRTLCVSCHRQTETYGRKADKFRTADELYFNPSNDYVTHT